MPTPRWLPLAAPAILLGLTACGDAPASGRATREPAEPREVRVAAAHASTLPDSVTVTGTLDAEESVDLAFEVPGRIGEMLVDLGDRVRPGEALARLDPTDFDLRVHQAQAALEQARARLGVDAGESAAAVDPAGTSVAKQAAARLAEVEARRSRIMKLHEEGIVSRADLDTVEAAYRVAEGGYDDALDEARNRRALAAQRASELELAREQREAAVLEAPFEGAIGKRHLSEGRYVGAGDPVVTLVRTDPLRLRLAIPERAAAGVSVDLPVRVTVEGDPVVREGRIARVGPAIDLASRTLAVEAEVPNPDGSLRAGSFVSAELVTSAERPVVLVPRSSIVTFAGVEKVLLVDGGTSKEARIRTGRRVGDSVEVVEGLDAGALVVVEPGNLVGGQPVTVVD